MIYEKTGIGYGVLSLLFFLLFKIQIRILITFFCNNRVSFNFQIKQVK